MDPSSNSTLIKFLHFCISYIKRNWQILGSQYRDVQRKLCKKMVWSTYEPYRLQIEHYPHGYPQFTRLLIAHPSFSISRRFLAMRARLLLMKQDELSLLEERMDEVDRTEPRKLFLGNLRRDKNESRKDVLKMVDKALKDYGEGSIQYTAWNGSESEDQFVSRFQVALDAGSVQRSEIISLHNWVKGTGSVNHEEASFLRNEEDLMSISGRPDKAQSFFQTCAVKAGVKLRYLFRKDHRSCPKGPSRDPRVHISKGSFIPRIYQSLVACVIILLLFVPVMIIMSVESNSIRIPVIVVSSGMFVLSMSGMTTASARELFIAGATYATVLVVFIAGNGSI